MTGADPWQWANVDPSAGVRLMPRMLLCPRCGGVKGRKGYDRPGLCVDCRDVLTNAEKAAWRAAA